MENDFNTPEALSAIYSLIRSANNYMMGRSRHSRETLKQYYDTILDLSRVLGLLQEFMPGRVEIGAEAESLLNLLLEVRSELRRKGLYEISDSIRSRLVELGIIVEDTKTGVKVRFRRHTR